MILKTTPGKWKPAEAGQIAKDDTMLVLTRKQGESIQIADNITIKVIKTAKGAVRIGIEAPDNVKVLRGELQEKLQAEATSVAFTEINNRGTSVDWVGYFPLPQTA